MWKSIFILVACFAQNNLLLADDIWIQSGIEKTNIIELYTSEGCSSCPPADAWFSKLKNKKGLGRSFIPLGFHVDFWDYLGWKDPGSSHEFTLRESKLVKSWKSNSIYTPAFAWNGTELRSWGSDLPETKQEIVGQLTVKRKNDKYEVEFLPSANLKKPQAHWTFYAAKVEMGVKSNPSRGENKGANLSHDFLVRELSTQNSTELNLPKVQFKIVEAKEIVFWVERDDELRPIQAVGTIK